MTIFEWLNEHPELLRAAAVGSLVTFLASLIGLPLLVAALPTRYFAEERAPAGRFAAHHPVLRASVLVLRNAMGAVLLLCGIAMLLLPGQGILTILVGLSFMTFPGKRRLELALVRQRRVHAALDWIRRRAHKPPLVVFERHRSDSGSPGGRAGGGAGAVGQSDRSSPSA